MEKIGLITDEGADLTREIIEKYDIGIVPVKLIWPEIENLPGENTFQKMRELEKQGIKSFGKTSQPSPKDFLDQYKEKLAKYEKIICVTLTSQHSGTFNSALMAKNFLSEQDQERIFVVDSWQASAGEAIFVLKAIDSIEKGKSLEEIVEDLKIFKSKIKTFIMLEDPKWLEYSGRISSMVANLFRALNQRGIRPFLIFKDGKLTPGGIKMKAKDKVLAFFNQFNNDNAAIKNTEKRIKAVITHGDNFYLAQRLKEMIENEFQNAKVEFVNIINNVVGAVTGPDTLILAWAEF